MSDEVESSPVPDTIHHVAIAPWAPSSSPQRTNWTIVPIAKSTALAHSTVQFSPASLALQSFATTLQQVAPSKLSSHSRSGIEILVLDVTAAPLDTVFVHIESDLVKRLENGEGTFFTDHPSSIKKVSAENDTPTDRLAAALRVALGTLKVVHNGDLFPLPLPPHPITHVPSTPGKVTLCEPVAQGILAPTTKIVLTRGHSQGKQGRKSVAAPQALKSVDQEDEDTATDQFYSAAEERDRPGAPNDTSDFVTETETEASEVENEDEISDDSMDEMISLQAPTLPTTNASGVSTMQPGTPMTIGRGRKTNGIGTPGSVFSSFTATTARPDRPKGRLFKANGLMNPIPSELLHPKPIAEDDEEARVYVDINSLTRIGCFSGDWVRLEASEEPPTNGIGLFGLGSFGQSGVEEPMWRPAKVYGLPEGYSHRPMTRIPSSKHDPNARRLSFFESQIPTPTGPGAYMSPLLLANLENAPYVRLSPLKKTSHPPRPGQSKITGSSRPPYARDLTLQQIRTPVSSEKALQTAIFGGLKVHFARSIRVVKSGDLVGIPIDTQLGRTLQESTSAGDGVALDDIVALSASSKSSALVTPKPDAVAWFKIAHITRQKSEPGDEEEEEDVWGGVACVDSSFTQISQSGGSTSSLPGTKDNNWPYYLGIEEAPQATSNLLSSVARQQPRVTSPLRRRLRELMAAATSKRAVHLKMPPVAVLLVSNQRNIGKATVASSACTDIGLHTFVIDAYDIVNESGAGGSDVKSEGLLKARADRAMSCGSECCALLIRHIEALTADRMVAAMKEILDDARVLIATTTEVDKVPDGIRGLFTHELEMSAPDEAERKSILQSIIQNRGVSLAPEVELSGVAIKTAALVAGDLVDVVERAIVARDSRLERLSRRASNDDSTVTVRDIQVAGGSSARCLTKADFDTAVEAARKNFADAIGAPKIPNVTWDDVGGLNNVKEAVMETIQLPLERPELFAKGMKKRSGILFYGPPGTGKTLLAKAIATEYSLNFFSVKGPELLNMYIGESEANVRRVFQRARDAKPCVVFFDELDSVAPKRGNQGDSGGVMDRIVSQLLAELDGMSGGDDGGGGVFVIGATNRPDLLDQALLRPGRFDKMLYLGVSDTHEKQLKIMEALTRKYVDNSFFFLLLVNPHTLTGKRRFTLHPSVSLPTVAEHLPFTYTGADFYALCSDAMLKAVTRQATLVDTKIKAINVDREKAEQQPISTANFFDHHATPEDIAVMVTERDFLDANRELIPSVSAGELSHYERVRATFENQDSKPKQQPNSQAPVSSMFPVDGNRPTSSRSVSGSKGKGKAMAISNSKGKGKAVAITNDEGSEDEGTYGNHSGSVNGRSKGKGKAIARFQDGTASDDDGLY